MESVELMRVSELFKRSRPCTSACSLRSASSNRPRARHGLSSATVHSGLGLPECEKDSTFSATLEVLDRRVVLVGRVVLPSEEFYKCPSGSNCLLFMDGDDEICCDILGFDVGVVRREIRVLSWNYIPFEGNGGFLEIIDWEFLEPVSCVWMRPCSGVSSLQLDTTTSVDCIDDPKARYFVLGFVEAVSPVKVQKIEDKENDGACISGFLVDIMSCECKLCKWKDSEAVFSILSIRGSTAHCYDKCVTVYFFGSMSALHPVITKLVGAFVFLSFLKKKMVFIGRKECRLMYITTKKSILRVLKLIKRHPPHNSMLCKGKGESGMYTGVIRGIYEQGRIMELDSEVWLLLASRSASLVHSLRVGALVSVRNVHFVKCEFSWTKTLILGGCVRTTINVECFSPLTTSVCTFSESPSQIEKFIDSLTFSARLWVLLIVASFRKKFVGLLSEKEIMGSKHSQGLAQAYAHYHLTFSKAKSQNGVFLDFCHHLSSECAGEGTHDHLKLVLHISNFVHLFGYCQERKYMSCPLPYYDGSNHLQIRKIISSKVINVVLVGRLQISSSTGRLQLVDATGGIDIVIQNISFNLNARNIYEVKRYNLIIEDFPAPVDTSVLRNKLCSLRHIFQYCPPPKVDIAPYVLCSMGDVNAVNPSNDWDNKLDKICNGSFDLLKVTHKFPKLQSADPAITDDISMFAEVIMLPWNLVVTSRYSSKDCEDRRADAVQHIGCESDQENPFNKKLKREIVPPNGMCSSLKKSNGTNQEAVSFGKMIQIQGCHSSYPVQLPCSVHIRSGENHNTVLPGLLNRMKSGCLRGGNSTSNAHKILLEFKYDSFLQFEALQIGCYYILQNDECADSKNNYYKVVIALGQRIMSFCFTYSDGVNNFSLCDVAPLDSCNDVDMHCQAHQNEMISLRKDIGCSTTCADVEIHISSEYRSCLEGDPKHTQEGYPKSLVAPHSISSSLPMGNLISLHGHVVAVTSSDQESGISNSTYKTFGGFNHMKYHQKNLTCLKIRFLTSNDIVSDLICTSSYSFPIGFGAGVDAHFHRILHHRSNEYLLTPVSFVEITSRRASIKHSHEQSNLSRTPTLTKLSTIGCVTSGLICQIMQGSESEPQWIRCRVLAIHILVFENNGPSAKYLDCKLADYPYIPLAGFILDDGSFTCCCWANADIAASLLKMNEEVPWLTVETRNSKESTAPHSTLSYHLKKILKKQGRITVKSYGSACESIDPDMIISITSPKLLHSSDEEVIKHLVANACVGKPLNVLGSVMDPDAVKRLEKHIREMDMTMPSIPHMWAKEVCSPNPLDEARALFQDLVKTNKNEEVS